jgi:hypothetical protein
LAALLTFVLVGLTVTLLALLWCAALPARPRLLAAAGLVSAITIAAFWTAVCFPGTLSQDSLDMWSQALHGKYNSWHPLGMTLAMRGVHRLLATWPMQCQVAAVAFLQGTMLWCAIFAALTLFIRPVRLRIAACAAPLLYYPLWLYTVTLWKDVWFAAAFLGLLCAAWPLLAGSTITRWRWLAVSTLLWLTLLNRSSATITFLALMVLPACVFAALRRFRPARRILALGSAALVCAVLGQNVLYKMLHVTGSGHLLDFYLAYDLVGTVKFSERPITRFANLQTYQAFGRERFERAVNGYSCGVRAGYLYWGPNPPFDQWALLDDSYALQDMPLLVLGFPGPYLKQKVCSLKSLLGVSGSQIDMPFQDSVVANRFGLASESLLPPVRERVAGFLDRASGSPGPLQLPFRHYALLALGAFAGLLAIGVAWYRGNVLAALPAIYLFTGGLAILLPWLVIIPSSDWRYLMPATTCWICGILASAASFLRDPAAPDCVSPGFSGPSSQT